MQATEENQEAGLAFSKLPSGNNIQEEIINTLAQIFGRDVADKNSLPQLKEKILPQKFISKNIQENYELYKVVQPELVKRK